VSRSRAGRAVAGLGWTGLVASLAVSVLAWLLMEDTFSRLESMLSATGEGLEAIDATLDVADQALASLTASLETAAQAAEQASTTSATVAEAVSRTADILDQDLPDSIEAVRATMPGLIEASAVVDRTLSGLALVGVPYDPEVPLDAAFRRLDTQLALLPATFREHGATIQALVPQTESFGRQAASIQEEVGAMQATIDQAALVIARYRRSAETVDLLTTMTGLETTRLLARLAVGTGALAAASIASGLILAGRWLLALETRP
jgi:ABC-type transporter Mla subunit MlaD